MKPFSAVQGVAVSCSGILTRLRRDRSGSTLAVIAIAIIPIAGMAGSAVDIGRSYLVKSRLQQACDAGVLATRRAMTGNAMPSNVLDSNSQSQGANIFNINFRAGSVNATNTSGPAGATNTSFATTGTSDGKVNGTASTRVPLTIAKLFGTEYIDIKVTCQATVNLSNVDVMMVLDVSGPKYCGVISVCNSVPEWRIPALQSAVVGFFDTINAAQDTGSRLRIGFVPFSQVVNVGTDPFTNTNILASSWMVDSWTYQSRVANMNTPGWQPNSISDGWVTYAITNQTFNGPLDAAACSNSGNDSAFGIFDPNPGVHQTAPTEVVSQAGKPSKVENIEWEFVSYTSNALGQTCKWRRNRSTTTYTMNGRFGFTSWSYLPVSYDVSSYRTGSPVSVYTDGAPPAGSVAAPGAYNMVDLVNSPGSTVSGTSTVFDGCVEERDTLPNSTFPTIPSGALDLDFITTPSSTASRWRPTWPEVMYDRTDLANEINVSISREPLSKSSSAYQSACPAPASKLAVRTRTDVQTYLNGLAPFGRAYPDTGMVWGLRMLSPTGMWESENATAPNGDSISRNLIIVTDDVPNYTPWPDPEDYGAHAYEKLDRRVMGSTTPSPSNMNTVHSERFLALCRAAQANNIVVWTVALGTSNPPTLAACASPGNSYTAANANALKARLSEIAERVGQLRLSK